MNVPENLTCVLDALLVHGYSNVNDINCMRVFIDDDGERWIDALFDVGRFCTEADSQVLVKFLTLINKLHSDPKRAAELFFKLDIPFGHTDDDYIIESLDDQILSDKYQKEGLPGRPINWKYVTVEICKQASCQT